MALSIRLKRGLLANLPATAPDGELLLATDTHQLFRGTGTGVEAVQIDVAKVLGLLDGGGKINSGLLPALALTEVNVVADITARDALTVQEGDVAVVTDAGADPQVASGQTASYIYDGAAWVRLQAVGAVSSVNGSVGDVVLDSDDISEGAVNLYYTDARVETYLQAQGYLKDGDNANRLGSGAENEYAILESDGAGGTRWSEILDLGTF